MAREFKFRAWDKQEKEMLYLDDLPDGVIVQIDSEGNILLLGEGPDDCVVGMQYYEIEHELMQFTGLKDSNGKEIFEGDIVFVAGEGYSKVSFDDTGRFIFESPTNFFDYVDCFEDIEYVQGNIYENPELLEAA